MCIAMGLDRVMPNEHSTPKGPSVCFCVAEQSLLVITRDNKPVNVSPLSIAVTCARLTVNRHSSEHVVVGSRASYSPGMFLHWNYL